MIGRFLLIFLVNMLFYDNDLSDEVKEDMRFIMSGSQQNAIRIGNAFVCGDGEIRDPTEEESQLLANENLQCLQLTEYLQCKKYNTR